LPGRKNVLWFSGSFPISILPDGDLQNPFAVVADSEDEFRETTDLLARSQAAVYPIDARGLMVAPMTNASNDGSKYGRNPGAYGKDLGKFFQQPAPSMRVRTTTRSPTRPPTRSGRASTARSK